MKIVAIDPGLTSAAIALEQINGTAMLLSLIDLPVMGEGAKRRLDAFTFARWLSDHALLNSSKEDCRARAIQLLPSAAGELQRVKDHHRAEAILLGFYGLEKGVTA